MKIPLIRKEKRLKEVGPSKSWELGDRHPGLCSASPGSGGGGQRHGKSPCHPGGLPSPALALVSSGLACAQACQVGMRVARLTSMSSREDSIGWC